MRNIFIDRDEEMAILRELKNKKFFLVVSGRRRIGKTFLLTKAFPNANYIFIWPNKSTDWILTEISREMQIPEFKNFKDLLNYLIDKEKVLILDEFQNISSVDKSIYGEIQKIVDERKFRNKPLKLAVAGSSYSLMTKIFNNIASPLYGRRTREIRLSYLPIKELFNWLNIPASDFIELWSVFEGVPYYFELINRDMNARENIRNLLISKNAKLQEEGRAVLSMEFGMQSKTYNTILTAISEGKTKLNEIANLFSNKTNLVTKYLDILRKEFGLVKRVTPIVEHPRKSKEGRYKINDNFLGFWFYFIERNRAYIEQERFEDLREYFEKNFNTFVGKIFEKFIISLIKDNLIRDLSKLRTTRIGKQFGRISKIHKKEKGEDTYEIDIVALNEKKKQILFCECKWKEKVNAERIIKELAEKAEYVDWHNKKRKESFALFAKSFKKKIKKFEGRKVYCFDLRDIERALKK